MSEKSSNHVPADTSGFDKKNFPQTAEKDSPQTISSYWRHQLESTKRGNPIWNGAGQSWLGFPKLSNFLTSLLKEERKWKSRANEKARINSAIVFRLCRHRDHTKWRNCVSSFIQSDNCDYQAIKDENHFWFYKNSMKRFQEKQPEVKIRAFTRSSTELSLNAIFKALV